MKSKADKLDVDKCIPFVLSKLSEVVENDDVNNAKINILKIKYLVLLS